MRTRSVILLALALVCGLIAAIGINQVMANRKNEHRPTGETKAIFVATMDIAPGDPITPKSVKLEEWPAGKIPEDALSQIEQMDGRRAKVKLYPGEVLRDIKLFKKGETGHLATELIPHGYRVVAVEVDEVAGGGALIRPGDRVDVLIHLERNPHKGIETTTTQTVLQDAKVFAVGAVFKVDPGRDDEKSLQAKTISLLVTPEQAQKVTMASEMGKIRLTLRSHSDSMQSNLSPTSPSFLHHLGEGASRLQESLFKPGPAESNELPKRSGILDFLNQLSKESKTEPAARESSPVAMEPKSDEWTMRVLTGEQVADVRMQRAGGVGTHWVTVGAEFEPAVPAAPLPPVPELPVTDVSDGEDHEPIDYEPPTGEGEVDGEASHPL